MKTAFPETVWKNPIHFLACGFGSGTAKFMPGTWGTLAAVPLYLVLRQFSPITYLIILTVAILFGVWICHITARDFGEADPGPIVWDEMVGFWLALWVAPNGWQWIVGAFILFRAFDIFKPWPINVAQEKLPGGWGIVVDDLLAGLYTWIIIQLVVWIFFALD
jgi:phosphatidylglycerophosphatase A